MSYKTDSTELDWVYLLVYVALPGTPTRPDFHPSTNTEVRMYAYLYTPAYMRNMSRQEKWEATHDKPKPKLWISAESPMATVQMANGKTYQVSIERLKTGFDPREAQLDLYAPGTALGEGEMDDFTLTLPEIFLNGEKIPTAPIHFKKREERYAPVLNC